MPLLFNSINCFHEKYYGTFIIYFGLFLIVFGGTNKPEIFMNKIFESNKNMGGVNYYIEYIGVFLIFFIFYFLFFVFYFLFFVYFFMMSRED